MSTVMELSGGDAGASAELMEEVARAAERDVDKVDARAEIKAVGAGRRWARPAAVLAVMLVAILVLWPKEAMRLMARAVAPFRQYRQRGRREIQGRAGRRRDAGRRRTPDRGQL